VYLRSKGGYTGQEKVAARPEMLPAGVHGLAMA
jgi:hypothetical protein